MEIHRTVVRLQTNSLLAFFHVQASASLRSLWTQLKKKGSRLLLILFSSLCEAASLIMCTWGVLARHFCIYLDFYLTAASACFNQILLGAVKNFCRPKQFLVASPVSECCTALSEANPFRSGCGDRFDFIIRVNPSTMPERWIKPEWMSVFALSRSKY